MDKFQNLLVELQRETDKIKQKKEEARKRGEAFNVFDVLGLSTNETRTHSAFIAELLNPQGNHGCGSLFLEEFIKQIHLDNLDMDLGETKVEVERSIGLKSSDATEGGRLDIVLQTKEIMIIIENKIYAGDQEKQLIRYWNYAQKEIKSGNVKHSIILYLTLDGHMASEDSANKDIKYTCVSYQDHILKWLNMCIGLSAQKPLIRETIIQYSNLIKQLTNQDMNTTDTQQMYEIMSKYPEAIAEIYHSGYEGYLKYVFEKYVSTKLRSFADNNGLIYKEEYLWGGGWKALYFYRSEWKHYSIKITNEHNSNFRDFFIGVTSRNEISNNEMLPVQERLNAFNNKGNRYWPFGYAYLPKYSSWWTNVTIDMINGNFAEFIENLVSEVLEELDERHINL